MSMTRPGLLDLLALRRAIVAPAPAIALRFAHDFIIG